MADASYTSHAFTDLHSERQRPVGLPEKTGKRGKMGKGNNLGKRKKCRTIHFIWKDGLNFSNMDLRRSCKS